MIEQLLFNVVFAALGIWLGWEIRKRWVDRRLNIRLGAMNERLKLMSEMPPARQTLIEVLDIIKEET